MVIGKVLITDIPLAEQMLVLLISNGQVLIYDIVVEKVTAHIARFVKSTPFNNFSVINSDFVKLSNSVIVFLLFKIYDYLAVQLTIRLISF